MTLAPSTAPAVEVLGLGKAFPRWPSRGARALEALSFGALRTHERRWVLRDVAFDVPRGGALGVVGANGAGKSTLLALLGGSLAPSAGRLRVQGRVAGVLELGGGFHPDFDGRANAELCAALLGVPRRERRAAVERAVAFADLGDAIDAPVRTYSTGMAMRLGFAVALETRPDVLLLDEVLAVGDLRFQKRCVDRLFEFRASGGTLVVTSHSLYDLRRLCDAGLWLDAGRVAAAGPADEVTHAYAGRVGADACPAPGSPPPPDLPRVSAVRAVDAATGGDVSSIGAGADLELVAEWVDPRPARAPLTLGFTLTRQDGTLLVGATTASDGVVVAGPAGEVRLRLPRLRLLAGSFTVVAHLLDEHGVHRHHERPLPGLLEVRARGASIGLVDHAREWSVRAAAPVGEVAA